MLQGTLLSTRDVVTRTECPLWVFSLKSLASTDEHQCLHFEVLNMYPVSYCILINFINTKWPDMFCKLPIVYQQVNYLYILQVHRNASFTVCTWLPLINGLTAMGNPPWNFLAKVMPL